MAAYAVQFVTRYDGLVIASFPDLPGVSALGRDDEEALGEALFAGLDLPALGYRVSETVAGEGATHVILSRAGS